MTKQIWWMMCSGNSRTVPRNSYHEVITGTLYACSHDHKVSTATWSWAMPQLTATMAGGLELILEGLLCWKWCCISNCTFNKCETRISALRIWFHSWQSLKTLFPFIQWFGKWTELATSHRNTGSVHIPQGLTMKLKDMNTDNAF